ncbi:short-chain dehydrogenase [Sphingobium sp. C100]|jgi:3-oxoacyl-[acyl-carrier protein] reductase|uniref:SDR family NAD(P)-dependent oxidoreductase n=1 Tax=Sphingobium sp. C100 TaxID=1207055 RepID=UPI0003D5E456|nr:SDR family oxidoreductase [Sphingobium sp. C100]ETI61198.1 short-chain dehydrogenase [Sphingobium sp. C100]
MNGRYAGRVAIITGAAGGLGEALALGYALEGARVELIDRDEEGLIETRRLIEQAGGVAIVHVLDLADEDAAAGLGAALRMNHPHIHVLINNAGIAYGDINGPVDSQGLAAWTRYLAVNTVAPMLLGQALRPSLAAAHGTILNMSSMASFAPTSIYGVTKAALNAMTHGMADAFGRDGIRVNAIAPGLMETTANLAQLAPQTHERIRAMQMIDGRGMPEDIVALALFLSSDDARFITADIITCDGGSRVRGYRR